MIWKTLWPGLIEAFRFLYFMLLYTKPEYNALMVILRYSTNTQENDTSDIYRFKYTGLDIHERTSSHRPFMLNYFVSNYNWVAESLNIWILFFKYVQVFILDQELFAFNLCSQISSSTLPGKTLYICQTWRLTC